MSARTAGRALAHQLWLPLEQPTRTPADLLTGLRARGLRDVERVRLTRNRSVMVSYADGVLRLHEEYLNAPEEVLHAIATFVGGRTRAARARARRTILGYPMALPGGGRPRRPERPHPDDVRLVAAFVEAHRAYNGRHFGGALAGIGIRVSRRMRARLGQYSAASAAGDPPEIAISWRHIRRHGWAEALETLLHEMVHQWQAESGLPLDHGSAFRAKARAVGISPGARRAVAGR